MKELYRVILFIVMAGLVGFLMKATSLMPLTDEPFMLSLFKMIVFTVIIYWGYECYEFIKKKIKNKKDH